MRRLFLSILLIAVSPIIAGCSSSTTVSEYAGLPRDQLPPDHQEYSAPGSPRMASRRERTDALVRRDAPSSETTSIDDENRRLGKATDICRGCGPKSPPAPSYARDDARSASDALASVPAETRIPR